MSRIIVKLPRLSPNVWIALAAGAAIATAAIAGVVLVRQTRLENARYERLRQLGEIVGALRQDGLSDLKVASRDLATQASPWLSGDSSRYGGLLSRLEGEVRITGADMAFLLDSTGHVRMRVQQSGEPDILGTDLAFRRYFQKAKTGAEDEFAALGAYTRKRGIYTSSPIVDPSGRFLGAAVFRLPASLIEARWLARLPDPTALVSREGVVFAANLPAWRLKVATTDQAAVDRLIATRQFGDSLTSMPLDLSRERIFYGGRKHSILRAELDNGWRLVSLLPNDASRPLSRPQWSAACGIAAAMLFLFALGLVVVLGLLRIRRSEQASHMLSQRLEEAERLEALGRLAGGMAHDFNNILTAIIGYASVLEYKLPMGSTEKDLAWRLGAAAKRASETVRQLMAFARRSGLQVMPISFHDLLRDLAISLKPDLPEGIRLELDLQASRDILIADPTHLAQAISNLAKNSISAMPEGGFITLATRVVDSPTGQMLELRTTDTGAGIPPELLPHLFEPFFTTKTGARGTGLGLASAWGTIQRHGGSIRVEGLPHRGTEFRIRLPLAPEGVEAKKPNEGRKWKTGP